MGPEPHGGGVGFSRLKRMDGELGRKQDCGMPVSLQRRSPILASEREVCGR